MSGFGGLAGPAAALWRTMLSSGPGMNYRQRLATANLTSGTFGAFPAGTPDAAWDAVEGASTDSTVDAGTGMVGRYGPLIAVHAIIRRGDAQAAYKQYGLEIGEFDSYALLDATEVTPTRGDLLYDIDGTIYAVSEQQRTVTVLGTIIGWVGQVERRLPGDPVYSV